MEALELVLVVAGTWMAVIGGVLALLAAAGRADEAADRLLPLRVTVAARAPLAGSGGDRRPRTGRVGLGARPGAATRR